MVMVMNWWLPHNFDKKRANVVSRAQCLRAIRSFFYARDFVEVDTPALQLCPGMDAHIHAFQTRFNPVDKSEGKDLYLHTSPEFDMKKLLSAGMERIFQMSHVYRNGESTARHTPEFMLLEWYRALATYEDLMRDCEAFLGDVARFLSVETLKYRGGECNPFLPFTRLSVVDAFHEFAGIDLSSVLEDRCGFAAVASESGVRVCDSDHWDDIFHAVMAEKIEPHLGFGVPCILYDYPLSMAALSRKKVSDPRFAERFELYVCGLELANAFSELTDSDVQRVRFDKEMDLKTKLYGDVYPPDEDFFSAVAHLPECAGIALGVDRLVMLLCGADTIDQVQWAGVNLR